MTELLTERQQVGCWVVFVTVMLVGAICIFVYGYLVATGPRM